MKTYELLVSDESDEIMCISLVKDPAIMANWVFFNKEEVKFATIDDEKRIIVSPVLIPDIRIPRIDGQGNEYAVYFSAPTIEKLAQKFLAKGYQGKATLEHGKNIDNDVTVVESWVSKSREMDKSALYFERKFPAGTWFITWKVNSDDLWNNYVKTGKVAGASIEGILEHKLVSMSIQDDTFISQLEEQDAIEMLGMIKGIIKKDNRYKGKKKIEMESYNDYPDAVSNNAKRGRELNEKNGNKCATAVGRIRSSQLEQKKNLSVETISRMYSYLSRAEVYYDESDTSSCGFISYMMWGGLAGKRWAESKLKELGRLEMSAVDMETSVGIASTYAGDFATGSVDMEVGVPHYTADGKLYEGPMHKDASGRLMTGETHSEDSQYLYHKEELPVEMEIEEGDVNPCQSGYIMIGFKDKEGRRVPNCVPEK